MKRSPVTLTDDSAGTLLVTVTPPSDGGKYEATVQISGDFGSGTAGLALSLDGGTTKVAAKDLSGVAYAVTANDVVTISITANGNNTSTLTNEPPLLYATLTGSSSPDLDFIVIDNL